jgi:hypothetical protein
VSASDFIFGGVGSLIAVLLAFAVVFSIAFAGQQEMVSARVLSVAFPAIIFGFSLLADVR